MRENPTAVPDTSLMSYINKPTFNSHVPYDTCRNKSANDPPEWAVRCWRLGRLRQWRCRDLPKVSSYQFRVLPFLCRPSFLAFVLLLCRVELEVNIYYVNYCCSSYECSAYCVERDGILDEVSFVPIRWITSHLKHAEIEKPTMEENTHLIEKFII
jgi:hypothetical protein